MKFLQGLNHSYMYHILKFGVSTITFEARKYYLNMLDRNLGFDTMQFTKTGITLFLDNIFEKFQRPLLEDS